MNVQREPTTFAINSTPACGFFHDGQPTDHDTGVVIVVGGPQTRVGSHRAFVYLADALASAGFTTLRFDTRGMGDSHGTFPGFEHLHDDINAAVSQLCAQRSHVKRVVLWGLCDGASAILIRSHELHPAIVGAILVNPWVHQPEGAGAAVAAQVQMKHYYLQKLTDGVFWKRLLTGKINPFRAGAELASTAKTASASTAPPTTPHASFVDQMCEGWTQSVFPLLVVTAGQDLVAQEWLACQKTPRWSKARRARTDYQHLDEANHTFSTAAWRAQVERWSAGWIQSVFHAAK